MRIMPIGVLGALVLSASVAYGQAAQSTTEPDSSRQVVTARSVVMPLPDRDKTSTFTAMVVEVSRQETVFSGGVVAQIEDTRITADRAFIRDGAIRFEGNVRVERPARVGMQLHPDGTRLFRFSVGATF